MLFGLFDKWSVAAHSDRVELRGGSYRSPHAISPCEVGEMSNRNVTVSLLAAGLTRRAGFDKQTASRKQYPGGKGLHPSSHPSIF